MPVTLTSWDGTAVGPATPYDLVWTLDGYAGYTSELDLTPRPDLPPRVSGQRQTATTRRAYIRRGSTAPALAQWQQDVNGLFHVAATADRTLQGTHNGVNLQIGARITSLDLMGGGVETVYVATVVFPDPVWQSQILNTDSSSPATVAGNRPALPVITVTPSGTTVRLRTVSIADNTGRGLYNHPVLITFDSSGVGASAASNFDIFISGARVPFLVSGMGTATTKLLVRVSVPASGSTDVQVYYGSSVANTLTVNALDDYGMAWTHASFSNSNWVYDDLSVVFTNPAVTGAWHLGRRFVAASQAYSSTVGRITLYADVTEASGTGVLGLTAGYDAIVLSTGIKTATGTLSGYTWGITSSTNTALYAYTREPGSVAWVRTVIVPQPTSGTGGSNTNTISIPGATYVAIRPDNILGGNVQGTVLITGGAGMVALDAAEAPTVTVGSPVTIYRLTDAVTNSTTGDSIAFDCYTDDDVTINTVTKTIAPDTIIGSILPSNPAQWFPLVVGNNSWAGPTGASSAMAWRDRYAT